MIMIISNTNDITMENIEEENSNEHSDNLISDPVKSIQNIKKCPDCSFICHLSKSLSSSENTEDILSSNWLF